MATKYYCNRYKKEVEEIVDPTVLNAYGVKEIANRLRNTIIESAAIIKDC